MEESKNLIGRKVWEFTKTNYNYTLNKEKTYIIVDVTNDGMTFVLEDENENRKEVDYYEVVVCPRKSWKGVDQIDDYLKHNGVYPEDVSSNGEESIRVEIEWGDWKHDHIWCDNLMSYIGYTCGDSVVTDENGSDCYSAIHYYYKNQN